MENRKNLQINCAACDVRNVSEELLATYEKVKINTAALVTSQAAQALLGRYAVEIHTANALSVEENVRFSTVNGPMSITAGQAVPEEKQVVVLNGSLTIESGCEKILSSYAGMTVNGPVTCPESIAGLLSAFTINGPIHAYPDGAIILKKTVVLDRIFYLRARQDALYYAAGKIVALAPDIDFARLAEKNVRFATKKLLVSESLAEAAVPLFDEKADIDVLPDGCAYVDGDAELDGTLIRRYGGKLYIDGDLTVTPDSAAVLDQVSCLYVNGDLLVCRGLRDRVLALDVTYNDLYVVGGVLITARPQVEINAAMLEDAADGLSLIACANVSIDSDVEPALLKEKLVSIVACASVVCATREQVRMVQTLGRDVAAFTLSCEAADEEEPAGDENTVKINAAVYTF